MLDAAHNILCNILSIIIIRVITSRMIRYREEQRMLKGILSIIAGAALNVASFSANSTCFAIFYEPEMPQKMLKLIK